MENNSLTEFIKSSETVRAAIVEATRRFYYDRITSNKKRDKKDLEETNASDVLSALWNLTPNWRYILEENSKKYFGENTKSTAIVGKPKREVVVEIEIKFKVEQ